MRATWTTGANWDFPRQIRMYKHPIYGNLSRECYELLFLFLLVIVSSWMKIILKYIFILFSSVLWKKDALSNNIPINMAMKLKSIKKSIQLLVLILNTHTFRNPTKTRMNTHTNASEDEHLHILLVPNSVLISVSEDGK